LIKPWGYHRTQAWMKSCVLGPEGRQIGLRLHDLPPANSWGRCSELRISVALLENIAPFLLRFTENERDSLLTLRVLRAFGEIERRRGVSRYHKGL
jgi:hypothetical protein